MLYRFVLVVVLCTVVTDVEVRSQDVDPPKASFTNATATRSVVVREQPRRFGFGWGTGALPPYRDTSAALRINTILMLPFIDVPNATNREYRATPDSTKLIYYNYRLGNYRTAVALQFDPTEENTLADWNSFQPRSYDTSGAAFGFATRHAIGIVPSDTFMTSPYGGSNPFIVQMRDNYNRYMLFEADYDTAAPGGGPLLVLSQPKPDNHLLNPMRVEPYFKTPMWAARQNNQPLYLRDDYKYGGPQTDTVVRGADSTYFQSRGDSTEWYLALNLRRWPNNAQNIVADTTLVLSLRVPVVLRIDSVKYHGGGIIDSIRRGSTTFTAYALFDSTATIATDTVLHTHYGFMDNTLASASTIDFQVRKGMLPAATATPRPDITLSAHFWLPRLIRNGQPVPYYDHHDIVDVNKVAEDDIEALTYLFRPLPDTAGWVRDTVVVSVGMEVYYHGNVDVGIDWLRLENRMARHLLRGFKDDYIVHRTQDLYDTLDTHDSLQGRGVSLYRHYFSDEVPASFWRTQRHVFRLLEDAGSCENDQVHTPHHIHQAYMPETWKGWFGTAYAGVPYYRFGSKGVGDTAAYNAMTFRTMNIGMGYKGAYYWNSYDPGNRYHLWNSDTLTFDYETGRSDTISVYDAADNTYRQAIANAAADGYLQAMYEQALILKLRQSPSAYYSNKHLWTQLWPMCRFYSHPVPDTILALLPVGRSENAFMFKDRPHTGEEIRFEIWTALALGTKAITYFAGGSSIGYVGSMGTPIDGYLGLTRQYRGNPHNIGEQLRTDSLEGGDFLDTNDIIRQYIHVPEVAARLEVDTNRLYIGMRSVRGEIQRIHDFVYNNEQHFMPLELQSAYAKGFKLIAHSRNSGVNFGDFFDTTVTGGVSQFHVRRIHDRDGDTWAGGDEPFKDSTFFTVTLLKDTAKSMDDVFYVAVVNRRTDPTVYHTGSIGTDLGDNIKFFSTAEFDSLVTAGDFDSTYVEPEYAQHGSRRITLPFKFDRLLQDSVFSFVRIREVGGTLDTFLTEPYLHSVDGRLSIPLKFKPGQGRLLQVKLLHPGTVPEGLLAYSNQRKMVCVPDPDDSTKVRYHIVYHRPEDGHNEVFYRYSKALTRNSDEANIVWEAEIPVSSTVLELFDLPNPTFGGVRHDHLNCAYPSIVVRRRADGEWSYHIVYACEHPDTSQDSQFIVEDQHVIDYSSMITNQSGFVIDTIAGRTLADWGTPVIGAVQGGNVYAWADSVEGIVVSCKPVDEIAPQSQLVLRFSETSDSCQHPSLATYTRSAIGERSTALVWQEDEQIYYASPYIDSTGALQLHRFPVSYPGDSLSWLPHNADSTILALCAAACTYNNRLSVVYRGIETATNTVAGGTVNGLIALDRIAWEGQRAPGSVASMILTRWIDLVTDTAATPWSYEFFLRSGLNKFYSLDPASKQTFHAPDIAQGVISGDTLWFGETGTALNNSDSAFVISFYGYTWPYQSGTPQRVWHLPYSYTNSGQWSVINPVDLQQDRIIDHGGAFPHQAARPAMEADTWWRNRRIFEVGPTPKILSSAQYYYRSPLPRSSFSIAEVMAFSKACNSIGMFEPVFGSVPVGMKPKPGVGRKAVDTLISDSFPMSGPTEVSFYVTGSDTSLAKVELVNTHTGTRATIALIPATETTATLVAETFTNGGGNLYRLEFIRQSTQAVYSTNMLAGQIPLQSSTGAIIGYAKSSGDERSGTPGRIVNLAVAGTAEAPGLHAYVYPNPAQNRVTISIYRTYTENFPALDNRRDDQLVVYVVSMFGNEVARFDARTGVSLELPVKHLPKGVYFVRVEQEGNSRENATTSFVLE